MITRELNPAPVFITLKRRRPKLLVGITSATSTYLLRGRLSYLREQGFDVTLVSAPGEWLAGTAGQEGVSYRGIEMRREIAPLADLASLFKLWRLLRHMKPAITDFSTPKAGLLGGMAARLAGVRRRVYTLRGLKLESATGFKRFLLCWAERVACASAGVVLCNSPSLLERALELKLAPAAKLRVLGPGSSNGVDTKKFRPAPGRCSPLRAQLGIPAGAPVIGYAGRLTRDKGILELLAAFEGVLKIAPNARLLLVGWFDESEDKLAGNIRERIASDARIACTGYVGDPAPYYHVMDLMVLPSRREGFPNCVLEAQASGIPVITTDATGARDSVLDGITGEIVPVGNPAALESAINSLLRDPDRRQAMAAAARCWVESVFARETIQQEAARFYWELIDSVAPEARSFGQTVPSLVLEKKL